MLKPEHAAILLAAVTLAAPLVMGKAALAADPTGSIEVCRIASAGDTHAGKPIDIPQGATFGDAGQGDAADHTGTYWPLWLATTDKMTIAADGKCVTGKARITTNLDKHSLHVGDHRWFVPSGTAIKPRDDWPSTFDLGATVTADFR